MEQQMENLRIQKLQKEQEIQLMKEEHAMKQEKQRREMEEREREIKLMSKDNEIKKQKQEAIKQQLGTINRSIVEANECAKILRKNIVFSS
jgi:hypothetical protein